MLLHRNLAVKLSFSVRECPAPSLPSPLPYYILCDVTYNGGQDKLDLKPNPSPGQLVYKRSKDRLERLQFYIDSLAGFERSYLAARYLRRVSPHYQRILLRDLSISDMAFNEVFCKENYGW